MNLDTLSYGDEIQQAVKRVRLSEKGGSWALLDYVNKVKRSSIMTVNVKEEGTIWTNLLDSFEDNRIQYAYAKLDLEAKGNMKLFLIRWIGKDVDENYKSSCIPHLTEIRNLLNPYDQLIYAMDPTEVQAMVHSFLCRNDTVTLQTVSMSPKEQSLGNPTQERRSRSRTFTSYLEEASIPRTRGGSLSYTYTPVLTSVDILPKIKVVIVGSSGVGKTFIYKNYDLGGLSDNNVFAITFTDIMFKTVKLGKYNFTLEIWDTGGQERFESFMPAWLRNAKVVICVYDITDRISYQEIPKHMLIAKRYVDPRAIFFLVGNKTDLVHRREVQEVGGEKIAIQYNMTFMECSGLTGSNILNLFENITKQVVFAFEDILTSLPDDKPIQLQLNDSNRQEGPRDKKCSC